MRLRRWTNSGILTAAILAGSDALAQNGTPLRQPAGPCGPTTAEAVPAMLKPAGKAVGGSETRHPRRLEHVRHGGLEARAGGHARGSRRRISEPQIVSVEDPAAQAELIRAQELCMRAGNDGHLSFPVALALAL